MNSETTSENDKESKKAANLCQNCSEKLKPKPLEEVPDYEESVRKSNTKSLFDCYLDVFDIMTQMEPMLFRTAVQTLKQHKSFDFDPD